MRIFFYTFVFIAGLLFFGGCSDDMEEYNKPAMYWYSKLVSSVADGNLEKADDYYSSLQGEHIGSPLLPEATMILAVAHMYYEEYILSEHFLDEYIRRYATDNEKEEAEFLKIKAKYMSLPNPRRDQELIKDTIKAAKAFKKNYPNSMYYYIVDTMLTRLYIAEASLNETIASLYERLDKPKSAAYYRAIEPEPWIEWEHVDDANSPWYRRWFEGDGKSSWYEFIVPDTQSVVSRNSIKNESNWKLLERLKQKQKQLKQKQSMTYQQVKQLDKAKSLLDMGAITQEEFDKIKKDILEKK